MHPPPLSQLMYEWYRDTSTSDLYVGSISLIVFFLSHPWETHSPRGPEVHVNPYGTPTQNVHYLTTNLLRSPIVA